MSAEKKLIALEEAVAILSKHVTDQIFKQVEAQKDKIGRHAADTVYMSILASLLGTLVYTTITEDVGGKLTKKEVEQILQKNYGHLKSGVEDAVAAGFSSAMSKYTGKDCEYYCQIKPIPAPVSTKPC